MWLCMVRDRAATWSSAVLVPCLASATNSCHCILSSGTLVSVVAVVAINVIIARIYNYLL